MFTNNALPAGNEAGPRVGRERGRSRAQGAGVAVEGCIWQPFLTHSRGPSQGDCERSASWGRKPPPRVPAASASGPRLAARGTPGLLSTCPSPETQATTWRLVPLNTRLPICADSIDLRDLEGAFSTSLGEGFQGLPLAPHCNVLFSSLACVGEQTLHSQSSPAGSVLAGAQPGSLFR